MVCDYIDTRFDYMVEIKKAVRERINPASSTVPVGHGVGRRKSSVARVWCYRGTGKGEFKVNGRGLEDYFQTHATRTAVALPLTVVPHIAAHYDIDVKVHGGGVCAQADAIKLGIARAFVSLHEDVRGVLRDHDLLTVDDRLKERKKYGQKAARRKFQFVKR
jgi:small subunit ribosomal protein S9